MKKNHSTWSDFPMELFEILKFVFNIQSANFNSSIWCSAASEV